MSAHAPSDLPRDVAVVGAGVAGLATALGCAQLGLKVTLVGALPGPRPRTAEAPYDLRIYAVSPASVALLEQLRVWPQVDAARVQDVARMRVRGDQGGELCFDAWSAAIGRLAVIAEESELLRVLVSACRFVPGIDFVDARFDRIEPLAESALLHLDDGRRIAARLVVGADGSNSAVRAGAGIGADELSYGQTGVVANFTCERAHLGEALQWFTGAEGVVALLPMPGRAVSLVWSAPTALAERLLALSPAELAERVTERSGAAWGRLAPLGAAAGFPLRRIVVQRLTAARLALVGDAAHVVHPLAGQGLNLGLQDVADLLAVVRDREPWRDPGDPRVLRRYERARAEPVVLMRTVTDGLARLFARDEGPVRFLRNAGLGLVDAIGPLKGALIRQAVGR